MQIIIRDILQSFFPLHYQHYLSYIKCKQQQQFQKQQQKYLNALKQSKQYQSKQVNKNKSKTRQNKKSKSKSKIDKKKNQQVQKQQEYNNQNKEENYEKQKNQAKQMINKKYDRIIQFIKSHRFYQQIEQQNNNNNNIIQQCLTLLNQKLALSITHLTSLPSFPPKNPSSLFPFPSSSSQPLHILSLYFNKQTNKQIFSLYEHILQSSSGISYQCLAKKLKTDIINVSHYCCKLKKMRFVQWEHKKDGVIVYAKCNRNNKDNKDCKNKQKNNIINNKQKNNNITPKQPHPTSQSLPLIPYPSLPHFSYPQSFLFPPLTLPQTIFLLLSSYSSLLSNGYTNQQIKHKLMKHSQNKMIRRSVQCMKNITKTAQRQGKVFEFKYKKQTIQMKQQIQKQIDKKRQENVIQLNIKCKQYINTVIKESQLLQCLQQQQQKSNILILSSQNFLLHLINTKLTQYHSSLGIKHSKRQCTPLKLNRYIIILNYLQSHGPQTQYQLRHHIIQQQQFNKIKINNGIIHKRSMIGILDGLVKIKLIEEQNGVYWPMWWGNEMKDEKIREINKRNCNNININISNNNNMKRKKMLIDNDNDDEEDQVISDYQDNQLNLLQLNHYISGKKKVKLDHNNKNNTKNNNNYKNNNNPSLHFNHKSIPIKMITQKQHLSQIFTSLLTITLQNSLHRIYRKSFHRIMYTHRKKQSIQMYKPQKNIFYLLDQQEQCFNDKKESENYMMNINNNNNNNNNNNITYNNNNITYNNNNNITYNNNNNNNNKRNIHISTPHSSTYPLFLSTIDNFIQTHGQTLQPYPQIQYQIIKYIRRHPNKNSNSLKSKYGKNWKSKFQQLEKCNIIQINNDGYEMKDDFDGYIV